MSDERATMLAVFAVHNAEEIAFGDRGTPFDPAVLARVGLEPEDYGPRRMALATAVITAAVAALTRGLEDSPGPVRAGAAVAAAGALALNGASHVGRAVRLREYNPGLVTAPALLVASARAARSAARAGGLRPGTTAACVAAGAVVTLPVIVGSLRLARLLRR
ncbi:HXXEE domain-containing protein [Cellulomonas uda]|uniref:HXXEE domain-containing protein n=1 Tax=Cellulomonas uda TaxID=1714 RepID=A0A4Y3KDC6_CELUD|nr:HXXEE domain-containing protein [Cellulomonas uda]NII66481.1 hypothetical protein [Cellulomonas uda]GEA81686.1 hypothetical protein CUD01_21300 [Cellulomonas uda]